MAFQDFLKLTDEELKQVYLNDAICQTRFLVSENANYCLSAEQVSLIIGFKDYNQLQYTKIHYRKN